MVYLDINVSPYTGVQTLQWCFKHKRWKDNEKAITALYQKGSSLEEDWRKDSETQREATGNESLETVDGSPRAAS